MRASLLVATVALLALAASAHAYTPAAQADQITSLPGLIDKPSFNQFSGYLTVDASKNRNIFYWYVESAGNPSTDPLIWWSNGGPGCSGLLGLLTEHGPFRTNANGGLDLYPHSWNKLANVLYVEAPAGVGFSFSDDQNDYTTNDTLTANDNYVAIQAFFEKFPERRANDFYISAESYGGVSRTTTTTAVVGWLVARGREGTGHAGGRGMRSILSLSALVRRILA